MSTLVADVVVGRLPVLPDAVGEVRVGHVGVHHHQSREPGEAAETQTMVKSDQTQLPADQWP